MASQEADLALVQNALLENEGCPESARHMLLQGASFVVAGEGARHAFMDEFAALLGESLDELAGAAGDQQATCSGAVGEATRLAAEAEAACEAAAAAAEAAKATAQAREEEAATLTKQVNAAAKEHKQAEKYGEREAKQRARLRQQHEQLVAVSDGALRMLLEDGWEEEDAMEEAVQAVQEALQSVNAEGVLLAAAAPALGKRAADRKPFDQITVSAVREALAKAVAQLGEEVAEMEPAEREAQAELLGLWAIADVARDSLAKAHEADAEASSALQGLVIAHKAAVVEAAERKAAKEAAEAEAAAAAEQVAGIAEAKAALARLLAGDYAAADEAMEPADEKSAAAAAEVPENPLLSVPTPMTA